MGSKSSKAPKPPDPKATARLQAQMNIDTALAQNAINRTNQVTDDGAIIYTETGKQKVGGRDIPIYTATTTLSDAQKRIKNEADAAKYNLANAASYLSGRINKEPFKVDEEVEARLFDLGNKRLAPRLAEARRQAETDAANRGLRLGSDAYDRLMRQVGENENDAYNQHALTSRAEAYAEADRDHARDLNYTTALLSGSQVSQPSFVSNTPQAGVDGVPLAQMVDNAYQNQFAAHQQEQAQNDARLGSLLSLAGTAIAYSDKRLKEDIHKVGETSDDLGIYSYRYKGGGPLRLGLIAQEVEKAKPEAVVKGPGGFKMVDYRKALRLGERVRTA
ncbi:tail fiber domain-containing protein [Taklimakanibacter deserti]|uniref:tail fiber domain-containing protein n=1 Tax=Taklimakanibacter deserti TaxID=2267839 RepID=UPI0013C429C1